MSHLLIRIAAMTAAVLYGGLMGYMGVSAAYELKGYWAAIPTALLILIVTGFAIGLFWMMP